jgi:DNA modification methylase
VPVPEVIPQRYEEHVELSRLVPHPANANEGDLGLLSGLLDANGFGGAVLAQEGTGILIDGETRWRTALERGMTGLPVLWLEVTDDQRDRLLASWNESTRRGRNDESKLVALLTGLAQTPRGLEGAGFDGDDLDALMAGLNGEQGGGGRPGLNGDPDDAPEPPVEAVTRTGDIWLLGEGHRLLCGDSTKREDVARLLGDERPDLMVTDPPYGVMYGGDKGKNSISGDLSQAAIPISFAVAIDHLADNARVYLFGGSGNWQMYASLFDHHLRMQVRPIVWAKESFVLRPNNYHSQFEMVYFGWKGKGGGPDFWFGDRTSSDLWEVSRREADTEKVHPTQKPVEVCAIPIRNSAPPGGLVYEPFGGSGSTLIAAHMLDRAARVIEIDPKWCDCILHRFERFTGIKPERVLPDGATEPVSFAEPAP